MDDAEAAAEAKYNAALTYARSARDSALAPVYAAEHAATAATAAATRATSAVSKGASDLRASAEAARDTATKAAEIIPWLVGGAVLLVGMFFLHRHSSKARNNPLDGHMAARWLLLGGTVIGGTGAALTTAGAATLQPEVLALSGPLMVAGAAMIGASSAAESFHESRS